MDFCVAKPFSSILYVSAAAGRALDWNGEFFIHDMLNAQCSIQAEKFVQYPIVFHIGTHNN